MKEKNLITEILDNIFAIDCQFFACKGPYKKFESMCTCKRCYLIQLIWKKYPKLKK